jgi:hypothetical protein
VRTGRIILVLLCASITLAVAAAGCGSSGGTSYSGTKPDAWAADVCGALSTWAHDLKSGSTALSFQVKGAKSVKVVKEKFISFLENAGTSTNTMITKVKAAGPPAVKDGQALQHDLESGLERARASFTKAIAKAKTLPSNNAQAFSRGVTSLGSDVEKELAATGNEFTKLGGKYKDQALNEATSKEPSCAKISG